MTLQAPMRCSELYILADKDVLGGVKSLEAQTSAPRYAVREYLNDTVLASVPLPKSYRLTLTMLKDHDYNLAGKTDFTLTVREPYGDTVYTGCRCTEMKETYEKNNARIETIVISAAGKQ